MLNSWESEKSREGVGFPVRVDQSNTLLDEFFLYIVFHTPYCMHPTMNFTILYS